MAQSNTSTKKATSEEKHINQLITNLESKYRKEFAVTPYDGVLVAMNKKAFAKTTAIDSLIYELTSFNGTSGTGLLQYMTPGSIIPLYPSTMKRSDGEVDVTPGHRFMDKVFILSGANHVDKTQQLIPNVHKYDKIISSMAQQVRNTERDQDFNSFSNNVGADVLDATSDDALTWKYVSDLFDTFFPEIDESEKNDYVLYIACHAKAAADYVLSNLVDGSESDKKEKPYLLVSPTTMRVVIDNERLCTDASAYCRMLICNQNEVMLKPDDVEKYYGTDLYVSDPMLQKFNNTLKLGMTFEETSCFKLPQCKFLVSMMASVVLYEHPIPVQLFSGRGDALAERLHVILNLYIKNKKLAPTKMGIADQLSCMSLGILNNTGISPERLKTYRNDAEQSENKHSPWPVTYQQHIRDNIKRILADGSNDVEKNVVQLKETMDSSVFHLLTLINYRDHVFNADVFKNASELYSDAVKRSPERYVEKPSDELNHIRIRPLCSRSVFEGKLSIVQNFFARFHYNPVAFKRFFVINSLYYLGNESPRMDEATVKAPMPDSIEIINGKGYVVDETPEFTCKECGAVPFYEKDGIHCLCFLLLKVVAALTGTEMNTLTTLKSVYDNYFKSVPCNFSFNGTMTSYKTLHNITINEVRSSCGYFGKIQLKHTGKSNGFGARKKMNSESVEVDGAINNDVKEHSEQDKEASSYLETRKLEWVVKSVKTEMGRLATLGDPNLSENGELKDNPLWSFQRLWLPSGELAGSTESEDLRCFVTGTKDDPLEVCRNAVLNYSGEVFPFLVTDQAVVNKHAEQTHFDGGSQTNRKTRSGWEVDEEVEVKKPKLDYRAIVTKNMESFVCSVLYKLLSSDQCRPTNIDQIHRQHRNLIVKWNEKPQKYKSLFKQTLLKIVLGGQHHNTHEPIDINDHQSLVARVVKEYLERLPTFFLNVHNAVAKTLGITPQELDEDFSKIVHYNEKTKREFMSWQDIGGADTLNKRSTMLTLFQIIRHEVEARNVKAASETQLASKANAMTILRNDAGPYCKTVAGNVNVHVPIIAEGNDGKLVLSISENPATSASVAFDMPLPVKMKVSLNVTQMDENKTKKCKLESNVTTMEHEDEDGDTELDRRFVPRPLLNDIKTSKVPVMANTPKPAHELIEILRDEFLSFTNVGKTQFADITKNASTIQILRQYVRERTNGKKVHRMHNLIMQSFFTMINRAMEQIVLLLNKTVMFLTNVVPSLNGKELLCFTTEKLSSDLICMRMLECAIHAVCTRNPHLTSALYLLALCSELYGPPCVAKDSNMDLERDSHALNAVVAACLRLFVGSDDCDKTTRKADSRQVRLVPMLWTYLKGREKPVVTTTDISRRFASQLMLTLQLGSYTSSYGKSAVFTSVRGGAPFTKTVTPIMNSVAKTQIIEGEYNHIVCRPLVWASNKFAERGKDSISTIVETYPLQMFIRQVLENTSIMLPGLLAYYVNFLSKSQEECTEGDLWDACVKAHNISSEDVDAELFKTVLLPKLYAVLTGCATHAEEEDDEEYEWTDGDE